MRTSLLLASALLTAGALCLWGLSETTLLSKDSSTEERHKSKPRFSLPPDRQASQRSEVESPLTESSAVTIQNVAPPQASSVQHQKAMKRLIKSYEEQRNVEQLSLLLKPDADALTIDLTLEALARLRASQSLLTIAKLAGYPDKREQHKLLDLLVKKDLSFEEKENLELAQIIRSQLVRTLRDLGSLANPSEQALARGGLEQMLRDCSPEQTQCDSELRGALAQLTTAGKL
jgi:hypothetical protein